MGKKKETTQKRYGVRITKFFDKRPCTSLTGNGNGASTTALHAAVRAAGHSAVAAGLASMPTMADAAAPPTCTAAIQIQPRPQLPVLRPGFRVVSMSPGHAMASNAPAAAKPAPAMAKHTLLHNYLLSQDVDDDGCTEVAWESPAAALATAARRGGRASPDLAEADTGSRASSQKPDPTASARQDEGGHSQQASGQPVRQSREEARHYARTLVQVVKQHAAAWPQAVATATAAAPTATAPSTERQGTTLDWLLADEPKSTGLAWRSSRRSAGTAVSARVACTACSPPSTRPGHADWGQAMGVAAAQQEGSSERLLQELLAGSQDQCTPLPSTAGRPRRLPGMASAVASGCVGSSTGVACSSGRGSRVQRTPPVPAPSEVAGKKRKALRELLDEVELIVQRHEAALAPPAQATGSGAPSAAATGGSPLLLPGRVPPALAGKENPKAPAATAQHPPDLGPSAAQVGLFSCRGVQPPVASHAAGTRGAVQSVAPPRDPPDCLPLERRLSHESSGCAGISGGSIREASHVVATPVATRPIPASSAPSPVHPPPPRHCALATWLSTAHAEALEPQEAGRSGLSSGPALSFSSADSQGDGPAAHGASATAVVGSAAGPAGFSPEAPADQYRAAALGRPQMVPQAVLLQAPSTVAPAGPAAPVAACAAATARTEWDDFDDLMADADFEALLPTQPLPRLLHSTLQPPPAAAGPGCEAAPATARGNSKGPLPATQPAAHPPPPAPMQRLPSEQWAATCGMEGDPLAGAGHDAGESAAPQPARGPRLVGGREEVHHIVLEVHEADSEKRLRLYSQYQNAELLVHLHDGWLDVPVEVGDYVNVMGSIACHHGVRHMRIDHKQGLLVLHPDLLLSGTSVTGAMKCTRQAFLADRHAGSTSQPAVVGIMLHELVQRALRMSLGDEQVAGGRGTTRPVSKEQLRGQIRDIVQSSSLKMLEAGLDEQAAERIMDERLDSLLAWLTTYVGTVPRANAQLNMGPGAANDPPTSVCISGVVDIEENVWAPRYGIKGQIDASLRVTVATHGPAAMRGGSSDGDGSGGVRSVGLQARRSACGPRQQQQLALEHEHDVCAGRQQQQQQQQQRAENSDQHSMVPTQQTMIVPFEFKSGREWYTHRAQVSLYLLLLEERQGGAAPLGLLWNAKGPGPMAAVRRNPAELGAIMTRRNQLAAFLAPAIPRLPPMLGDRHVCQRCYAAPVCALQHKALEDGNGGSSGMAAEQFDQLTGHLSPAHTAFYGHWSRLLALEESAARLARSRVWAISGRERQALGGCIASLQLQAYDGVLQTAEGTMYSYTFRSRASSHRPPLLACAATLPPCHTATATSAAHDAASHPIYGGALADLSRARQRAGGGVDGGAAADAEDPAAAAAAAGGTACTNPVEEPTSLAELGFNEGDQVLLSVEARHVAAARVAVAEVSSDTIRVLIRRQLPIARFLLPASQQQQQQQPPSPDHVQPQHPHKQPPGQVGPNCLLGHATGRPAPARVASTCQLPAVASAAANAATATSGGDSACGTGVPGAASLQWRLDKDEPASTFTAMRTYLAALFAPAGDKPAHPHVARLRQLVVDLDTPQQSSLKASIPGDPAMNQDQHAAVEQVLRMRHYALLLGMPGTGKTTTIVQIIRALLRCGSSVLVASYTNSAVDNILVKLAACDVPFVRLGHIGAVHPAVREHVPGGAKYPDTSVAGLKQLAAGVSVFGCTCLSVHHALLAGRTFDVCIIDEASQISLPASLGPLLCARTFVLVGDHYQLSPLVTSPGAAQQGFGVSLFRRLSEAHPQAVVTLRRQYRMAADIMRLSNTLVYGGRLLCGSGTVASKLLSLPRRLEAAMPGADGGGAATSATLPPAWLEASLDPSRRVVFLDTDCWPGGREALRCGGVINPGEVALVMRLVGGLVAAGLPAGDIGIISPYKAQVMMLQKAILDSDATCSAQCTDRGPFGPSCPDGDRAPSNLSAVEALTVDKYQGRDKPCIIISFVRSNTEGQAGRLLADWQRINVAITRAQAKLLMVGSASTLTAIPLLKHLLQLVREGGELVPVTSLC